MSLSKRIFPVAMSAVMLTASGCSLFEKSAETTAISTIEASADERYITTTQTARQTIDANANDEDLQGYATTTQDTETGTLENPLPDDPDPEILATTSATTRGTTTTTKKKTTSKKTTTTAETQLVKDKLHAPLDSEKFESKVKYKIVSDTTYLNLRFGPSKSYDIQLQIPDGKEIYGTAKTKDDKGNYWIYVSYKGTSGWVMEELLEKS